MFMEVSTMEYVYAALLVHKAGKKVDEHAVKKVLEAAGTHPDDARVKALVAALEGVNIDEACKKASFASAAPAHAAPAAGHAPAEHHKKEEAKPKDDKKSEEQAAAGLSALFG